MKNILIVCADKEMRKDVSKLVAGKLNRVYLDVEDLIGYQLINAPSVELKMASEYMRQVESGCIERAKQYTESVVTISHDLFVAQDNFNKFNNWFKVFIEVSKSQFVARCGEDKNKLSQELVLFDEINKLIRANSDITINNELKTIEQVGEEILNKIKS